MWSLRVELDVRPAPGEPARRGLLSQSLPRWGSSTLRPVFCRNPSLLLSAMIPHSQATPGHPSHPPAGGSWWSHFAGVPTEGCGVCAGVPRFFRVWSCLLWGWCVYGPVSGRCVWSYLVGGGCVWGCVWGSWVGRPGGLLPGRCSAPFLPASPNLSPSSLSQTGRACGQDRPLHLAETF